MSVQLVVRGSVFSADNKGPLGGILVTTFVGRATRAAASSVTSGLGAFTVNLDAGKQAVLAGETTLKFSLSLPDSKTAFHTTGAMRLDGLVKGGIAIAVPAAALAAAFAKPKLELLADGSRATEIEVGQSLSVTGSRFRPSASHEVRLSLAGKAVATLSLATDQYGVLPITMIAPQLGLWAFESADVFSLPQGIETFGGRTVAVEVLFQKKAVASAKVTVKKRSSLPLGFVSDAAGRLQNWVQHDKHALFLTIANLPKASALQVVIVPRQGGWNIGDPIAPAGGRSGRPLVRDVKPAGAVQTMQLLEAGEIVPGAYDVIVRPVRYGYEDDEVPLLRTRDLVIGRHLTGLVVREDFWLGKPVLGGCVNSFPMSGSPVSQRPYYKYRDTFALGENVWAAMDPGLVMAGQFGKKVAFYVVNSKTQAQWGSSTSLTHVPGIAPVEIIVQSGCINANEALVWPAANQIGTYDIVADFGNNAANPATFMKDASFDTPIDMIDGYFNPGFRIVNDPGTMADFSNVGAFDIDSTLLTSLGLATSMTVPDEHGAYFPPGGFTTINRTFARLAMVRFPADSAGATNASQISVAQADYPLAMIVHGNGHTYTNYAFLLDHLAANGFVAVSSSCRAASMASRARTRSSTTSTPSGSSSAASFKTVSACSDTAAEEKRCSRSRASTIRRG